MQQEHEQNTNKLDLLLSKVQKESHSDEYIYGVTSSKGRSFIKRINDFLIDHSSIATRDKEYFFELLATMLRAGIPMNRSLKILASRTGSPRLKRIVSTISYELEHGRSLSQALDRFPEVFAESERGVIKSAEAVGHLEEMLFKVATTLNRHNELRARLIGALIYPSAVLVSLVAGIAAMLIFVVPKIQGIFAESSLTLPLPTRILLIMSLFLTKAWWLLLIIILFAIIGFHVYVSSDEGRFAWDFRKLRLPFIGELLRKIYVMRFVDLLGLLIESGLPINKALEFVAGSVGNEIYRLKTYEALGRVQQGEKLSAMCASAPFLFPESVTNILAVGEYSASLGEISQKIGGYFEREINHTLKTMTTVLGPLLILVLGLLVAFFALAILSPIFSLTESVA